MNKGLLNELEEMERRNQLRAEKKILFHNRAEIIQTKKIISRCLRKIYSHYQNGKKWSVLKAMTYNKYGRICGCCGSVYDLHIDHIKPVSKFPHLALNFDNLQVLCRICNLRKKNNIIDYRILENGR